MRVAVRWITTPSGASTSRRPAGTRTWTSGVVRPVSPRTASAVRPPSRAPRPAASTCDPSLLCGGVGHGGGEVHASMRRTPLAGPQPMFDRAPRQVFAGLSAGDDAVLDKEQPSQRRRGVEQPRPPLEVGRCEDRSARHPSRVRPSGGLHHQPREPVDNGQEAMVFSMWMRASSCSSQVLRRRPPPNPTSLPSEPMTRWHAMMIGSGLRWHANPTACAPPG